MDWKEIVNINNPRQAMLEIDKMVSKENLLLEEMIEIVEQYAELHGVTIEEMSFYPDGRRVIGTQGWN